MVRSGQNASPWSHLFFIFKCGPTSQAGRRGFESHLPLHVVNRLEPYCNLPFARNDSSARVSAGIRLFGPPGSGLGSRRFKSCRPDGHQTRSVELNTVATNSGRADAPALASAKALAHGATRLYLSAVWSVIFDFGDFLVISVLCKSNGVPTIDYHAGAIFLLDCLRELGGFSSNIYPSKESRNYSSSCSQLPGEHENRITRCQDCVEDVPREKPSTTSNSGRSIFA